VSPLRRVAPTKRRRPRRAGLGNPEPEVASPLQGHTRGDGALQPRTPHPFDPASPVAPNPWGPEARAEARFLTPTAGTPGANGPGRPRGAPHAVARDAPPSRAGGGAAFPPPLAPSARAPTGVAGRLAVASATDGGRRGPRRDPRQHRGFRRFAGGGGRVDGCGSTGPKRPSASALGAAVPRLGGALRTPPRRGAAPGRDGARGRGGRSYVRDGGGEDEPLVPRAAVRPSREAGTDGGPRAGAPRFGDGPRAGAPRPAAPPRGPEGPQGHAAGGRRRPPAEAVPMAGPPRGRGTP